MFKIFGIVGKKVLINYLGSVLKLIDANLYFLHFST